MAECKGCHAEIEWVTLENGKAHPVNPKRVNVIVGENVEAPEPGKRYGRIIQAWVSHFATCEMAEKFRRAP